MILGHTLAFHIVVLIFLFLILLFITIAALMPPPSGKDNVKNS